MSTFRGTKDPGSYLDMPSCLINDNSFPDGVWIGYDGE